MSIKQRTVAAVGLVLITGGILGATTTAASAAPANDTAQSVENGRRAGNDRHDHRSDGKGRDGRRDRTYTAGRFDNRQACKWFGRLGDRNDWWEDPRCVRVGHSTWILRVQPDHDRNRRH
jgi:hypothetical protein